MSGEGFTASSSCQSIHQTRVESIFSGCHFHRRCTTGRTFFNNRHQDVPSSTTVQLASEATSSSDLSPWSKFHLVTGIWLPVAMAEIDQRFLPMYPHRISLPRRQGRTHNCKRPTAATAPRLVCHFSTRTPRKSTSDDIRR